MKNILNYFTNKAICAAFVVLGAMSVSAEELIKTPIIQTFDGVEESVGYTVTGFENKNEYAVVFTNHLRAATWTVPADLENVQFLVVGGGGGGGAGTQGPGGGGGGVVTGKIVSLSYGDSVVAKVGVGGKPGTDNAFSGNVGEDSYFKVDDVKYVTAFRGGAGRGGKDNIKGGSGGGGKSKGKGGSATQGNINPDIVDRVYDCELFGEAGGDGYPNGNSGGGGGGALGSGGTPTGTTYGGTGGPGLPCDITGTLLTYGSGGGGSGSKGSSGGDGAGSGGNPASSGKANQGGGGGGGCGYGGDGGNGGSGIVVFRYTVPDKVIFVPEIESKVYNGENQMADVPASKGYTVTQSGGMNVGSYDVVLTLNEGYKWTDNSTDVISLKFNITPAANEWTVEPSITKDSWTVGIDEPGVLTPGSTKFDSVSVTITKDGGESLGFEGTLPTEPGNYVITYTVPVSDNYTNPDVTLKSVTFTVLSGDAIPPYEISMGDISIDNELKLSIPYNFTCDATTTKTATLFALYALDGAAETNVVELTKGVALSGGNGTATVTNMKPGSTYYVAIYAQVDDEVSASTELKSVVAPGPAELLNVSATYTNDPKEYIVSGVINPGLGEATVKVMWSLNSDACDQTSNAELNEDGTFICKISCNSLLDQLTYKIVVENTITTEYGTDSWTDSSETGTKARADSANVTYTWTGNGSDILWSNPDNWSASSNTCRGYPNSYDYAKVKFTTAAVVDLNGQKVYLRKDGFECTKNLGEVKLINGSIQFNSSGSDMSFGASGTTVVFDDVALGGFRGLIFVANSPTVFSGNKTQGWSYSPWGGDNTHFVVRDGEMSSTFYQSWFGTDRYHSVTISNAVWTINKNGANPHRLGCSVTFADGDEYQARVISTTDKGLTLQWGYHISIPKDGHEYPSITAVKTDSTSPNCSFYLDVANYKSGKPVPLVKFTSKEDQNLKLTDVKLVARENGENVTQSRNAQLVWDGATNMLYYQQDPQVVAELNGVEYRTLDDAIVEADDENDVIKIVEDFKTSSAIVVEGKSVTIDLNGKTVKANDTAAATDGNGVFWVKKDGVLTFEDSSEDKSGTVDGNGGNGYKMAIWADGGKVVINAGNYVNENDGTHTQYDLIYAKNGGEIVINGGTFKCDTPRWTLNSHNTNTGTFVVTGGKFYKYNPTDFDTDEAVTTWCDAKYRAEADEDGWYVVKEGYTVSNELSAVTVTADDEDGALKQVEIKVTAPEGVDAKVYDEYFKLVATETAEGSKTWTVALALKEEVRPVIAETMADDSTKEAFVIDADGNVTLNINNKKAGLYYGVQVFAGLGADPVAVVPETEAGALVVTVDDIPDGNAAFFKVVVDFKPIPEAE